MFFSLERNWEKDKLIMGKQVSNLGDYADPVWVSYRWIIISDLGWLFDF